MNQDRDSSHGLLIASGIFDQLVPGSPAKFYLGVRCRRFKRGCTGFDAGGQGFELLGDARIERGRRGQVILWRLGTRLAEIFFELDDRGAQGFNRVHW